MKKLYGVMALGVMLGNAASCMDEGLGVQRRLKQAAKFSARRFVDFHEKNKSNAPLIPWVPELESVADLATFFATHSTNPRVIQAAHLLRSGAKSASILGNARKTSELVSEKFPDGSYPLTSGLQAAGTILNTGHTVIHDLPDSWQQAQHSTAIARRNQKPSALAQKAFNREKIWQVSLFLAQFLTAWLERNHMNTYNTASWGNIEANNALQGRGLVGTIRNLLRLWQQSRLSKYYRKNLEYTLHPEKEQAAIQAQLDRAERKRLLWEERKEKLGALPGNVWHFLKEKGIDPLGRFGEKEWRHIASLVTNFFKK